MRRLRAVVDGCIGWLLVVLMGVAVINVLWQVFTRYVLSDASSFTEKAAQYLLVWITVIGASYAAGGRMHLAIDLLPAKLAGRRAGAILDLLINGCVLLFALLVLVIGGLSFASTTLATGETSPALGMRVGYIYAALPFAGVIMMMYAALNAAERLAGKRDSIAPDRSSSLPRPARSR